METKCTKCGKIIPIKEEYIWKKVKCPWCNEVFEVSEFKEEKEEENIINIEKNNLVGEDIFLALCEKWNIIDSKLEKVFKEKWFENTFSLEMKNEYLLLIEELVKTKIIDQYILAKISLSYLFLLIIKNETSEAIWLWNWQDDSINPLFKMWIEIIEKFPVLSMKDNILYSEICAILHSSNLNLTSLETKNSSMEFYMKKICYYYLEVKDFDWLFKVLHLWKYLQNKIFNWNIPENTWINVFLDIFKKSWAKIEIPANIPFSSFPDKWILPPKIDQIKSNSNEKIEKTENISEIDNDSSKQSILKKFFSFEWRINRMQFFVRFLLISLFIIIVTIFIYILWSFLWYSEKYIDDFIYKIKVLYAFPYMFIITKRLHDLKIYWWWTTFFIFVQIFIIALFFASWDKKNNKYWNIPN